MFQIRPKTFETNSSSVHSLTICTKQEYEDWKDGRLVLDTWNDELTDPSELSVKEYGRDRYIAASEYDGYYDYVETYEYSFTTPSGDDMVAFGYYGHD